MASSGALEEPAKSRGSFRTSVLGTGGRTESFVPLYRLARSVQLKRRLPPPLLQTGLASLQGVRDGARGWREKGKSLGGRRAGPAASPSRDSRLSACSLCAWLGLGRAVRRDPRPSLGAPLLLRPRARRGEATPGGGAFQSGWGFGGRSLLSLARGLAGKEGESGDTHSPRRARIAHSQPRAPAEARPGRVWPRDSGTGTCPLCAQRPTPPPALRPRGLSSALLLLRPWVATTSR